MMKSKTWMVPVLGAAAVFILWAGSSLFFQGPLGDRLARTENRLMLLELLVFFWWNFFWLSRGKVWFRCAGVLASFVVFLWLHQILVPILVSGAYLSVLVGLGYWVKQKLHLTIKTKSWLVLGLVDFLAGYAVWVSLVCLLSLFRVGSIRNLRILALLLGAIASVTVFVRREQIISAIRMKRHSGLEWYSERDSSRLCRNGAAAAGSLFFLFWMIQAGRLNIALDYDSLHYGLRSAYILDNGKGIYDDLGNINLVYTYSKGFEILSLPLAGTATYGFVLSLNLWITILVLAAIFVLAEEVAERRTAFLAVLMAAGIPAIMNMSNTAKSDNLTLLFQLLCLYGCLLCIKRRELSDFLLAAIAYILTLTLKPTAIIFSSVLFGISILYLLRKEGTGFKQRLSFRNSWWLLFVPALTAWFGTWARTLWMTGVPITSIFTGLLKQIGFVVKEPFAFMGVPVNGISLTLAESVWHLVLRLYRVLLAPVGTDMAHVNIAWGGGMVVFTLLAGLVLLRAVPGRKTGAANYLAVVLAAIGGISLLSLYLLWQVDGNYYQLFYVLVILWFAAIWGSREYNRKAGQTERWKKGFLICLMPLLCFQLLIMSLTNWAGVSGLTPAKLKHQGWYNHMAENYQKMCDNGCQQIWNTLAQDPQTRVIAFGDHPQVLSFPCNIQSYYDVTGSGGNVWLVKKLDYFKDFLRYAKTEYIYVQAGYLEEGTRAEEVVRFMIEDGSLRDIIYENGNLLGRVALDDEPVQGEQELARYYEQYKR